MDVKYLGHSSFLLKGSNTTVVTDPFDSKMVGLKFPKISADLVTISHDHKDHNQSNLVSDTKRVISSPGEYEIEGVTIRGIRSFHDDKKGEERGKNIIFTIDIDDVSVCHLGDLGHDLSDSIVQEIGGINVLLIPIGGKYTINSKTAVEIAKKLEPNFVIPMHYQMPGLNTEIFSELENEKAFISDLGLKIDNTKKLSIKSGSFSDEDQMIVMLEI